MNTCEQQMIDAVNKYRFDHKLQPLMVHPVLMRVAKERVHDFNRNHPVFGWVWNHAQKRGFRGYCTDNVARGYALSLSDVVTRWDIDETSSGYAMHMKGYRKLNGAWVDWNFDFIGTACDSLSLGVSTYIAVFGRLDN